MGQAISKAKLSYLRRFQQKKFRELEDGFIIEGWRLLEEALQNGVAIRELVYEDGRDFRGERGAMLGVAVTRAQEVWTATDWQMAQLSETRQSQGVLALIGRRRAEWTELSARLGRLASGRVVALDGLADPGNCGTILRSADWFGLDAALMGEGSAELENGKVTRASMGSIFHLPIAANVRLPAALKELKEAGYAVIATSLQGDRGLAGFAWPKKAVLVVGNEARGASEAVVATADTRLKIESFGKAESLNAAIAASVCLAHWRLGEG